MAMPTTELQCPWPDCVYKTPAHEGPVRIQLPQMHQAAVHRPASLSERQPRAKLPHLEVSEDGTVTEAALGVFRQQLTSYKRSLGTSAPCDALPDTILQSLPPIAYNLLFARYGEAPTTQTEADLLKNIEALMVRPENKLSYVLKLHNMKQEQGQPVAHFSACVRVAARRCQFKVTCSCQTQVSYEDDMVLY